MTNLPFGRQIGALNEMDELYREILREFSRVLKSGGKAIVLVEDGKLLSKAAALNSLDCNELLKLSLKGILTSIYEIRK